MGLFDRLFKKKMYYFDKNIAPQCSYCQFGRRTKDGREILCENKGIMSEEDSCKQFIYAPLKRIPKKQFDIEGVLADDEDIYVMFQEEELEALELPEMPDEMKAPDVPDMLKAPDLPDTLKQSELMDILKETSEAEEIPVPTLSEEIPPEVPNVPDLPDIPDAPGKDE